MALLVFIVDVTESDKHVLFDCEFAKKCGITYHLITNGLSVFSYHKEKPNYQPPIQSVTTSY